MENIVLLSGVQPFDTILFQYPIVFGFVHPRGPRYIHVSYHNSHSSCDIRCRLYVLLCSFPHSCKKMCILLCMFYNLQQYNNKMCISTRQLMGNY